jgi:hypothetical protein
MQSGPDDALHWGQPSPDLGLKSNKPQSMARKEALEESPSLSRLSSWVDLQQLINRRKYKDAITPGFYRLLRRMSL